MSKRQVYGVLVGLGLLLSGCVPPPPVVIPDPPPIPERTVAVIAHTPEGTGVADAAVTIGGVLAPTRTNADGYTRQQVPTQPAAVVITVDAGVAYQRYEQAHALPPTNVDVPITLARIAPTRPRPPTAAEVRTYRGYLSGLKDSAGRHIWTPALPGAPDAVAQEWLDRLAAAGATHVPIGPFTPGPAYVAAGHPPVVHWDNPDWTRNPAAIRGLIDRIRFTPTRAGHGMIPVIFPHGDDREGTYPREGPIIVPTLLTALEGIGAFTWTLPCGWESAGWRASECDAAQRTWAEARTGTLLAWHGWPGRSNGARNDPYNPQPEPWLDPPVVEADGRVARYGNGAEFWATTAFEAFLYQAHPIRTVAEAQCGKVPYTDAHGKSGLAWTEPDCTWKVELASMGYRVGRSICADGFGDGPPCSWPTRIVVFFEAVAYFYTRGLIDNPVQDAVADAAEAVCRELQVSCGYGDGLPASLRP